MTRRREPNGTRFVVGLVSGTELAAGFSVLLDEEPVASAIPLTKRMSFGVSPGVAWRG